MVTIQRMKSNLLGEKTYLGPNGLTVVPRKLFSANYFHYKAGQHVVFGSPSTKGKTELAFDLLSVKATPDLPAYVAVSKPTDPVTMKRGKELNFRFVRDWPTQRRISELWEGRPRGYIIWPEFGNITEDFNNAAGVTARLMADRYTASARNKKHSQGILVMDDTMVKAKVMGLDNQMVTILAMAGAMGIGLWIFVQKPTDSGRTALWGFENGHHFFFGKGGDQRGLMRYMQVGNDNPMLVYETIPQLQDYQFLYLHDDEMCIVDAKE